MTLMRSTDDVLSERITAIHTLDESLSNFWRSLPVEFRLTPSAIAAVSPDLLPKLLLMNIVYHQSLCALHASIVPLFSWSPGDDSWSTARHLSAQVAFEHAVEVSSVIAATLSDYSRISAMPSFISYAAYCGCAIQIPFMWCANELVRDRAQANVRTNIKMIDAMAAYWKFAASLVRDLMLMSLQIH